MNEDDVKALQKYATEARDLLKDLMSDARSYIDARDKGKAEAVLWSTLSRASWFVTYTKFPEIK